MKLEIRNNALHISGYVNAVERESRRLPRKVCARARSDFVEKISVGAFTRALSLVDEIRLMYNHTRDIGGTADGTLKLTEDNIGLYAEAVVTDSEVIAAAKRGELRGWSFGFTNALDRWEDAANGLQRRTIDSLELHEVSILSITPAYAGTSIEVRGGLDEALTAFEMETRTSEDKGKIHTQSAADNAESAMEFYKREVELAKMKGEF